MNCLLTWPRTALDPQIGRGAGGRHHVGCCGRGDAWSGCVGVGPGWIGAAPRRGSARARACSIRGGPGKAAFPVLGVGRGLWTKTLPPMQVDILTNMTF